METAPPYDLTDATQCHFSCHHSCAQMQGGLKSHRVQYVGWEIGKPSCRKGHQKG